MAAGLCAGRDKSVDAHVDRRQRSLQRGDHHPHSDARALQPLDPARIRRLPVEDDERNALAGADLDVVVGDPGGAAPERGVDEVDAERPTGQRPGLVDQQQQPRRRLGGGAEDAETAGVGDRRHQQRARARSGT